MDLPTALIALIVVAVIAYVVTVVQAATTRTLGRPSEVVQPEERLLAWPKWLLGLVAVLLVIWLLYQVRGVLLPFILGAVIAYLLNPGITRLEKRGWSRGAAVWVVFGSFLAVFVVAIVLLIPVLADQARDLVRNYDRYTADAQHLLGRLRATLEVLPPDAQQVVDNVTLQVQNFGRNLLLSIPTVLNRSLSLVSLLIITPVVTFWVLRDYRRLGRKVIRMVPDQRRGTTLELLSEINKLVGSYLLGMAVMVVIVGVYAIVVLSIAGVNFAALLGLMTGILYLIPYLGYPAAMITVAIVMAVTDQTLGAIAIVIGILLAGNAAFDLIVTPRIVGSRVGLHPLVIIFALLAGATLMGVLGMILAVPAAGSIKVVLLRFWPEFFSPEPSIAESGEACS